MRGKPKLVSFYLGRREPFRACPHFP